MLSGEYGDYMTDSPLVSIVIPVYNGSNYLAEAIDSALAQTYENLEVLVVNDGSDDGDATKNIALLYGKKIKYFEKKNGGVSSALNKGINEMRGEYFSWLSHDDIYTPCKISEQIEYLFRINEKKCVIYSNACIFDDDPNNCIERIDIPEESNSFRYWLTEKNILHGCSLLIPKIAFKECGLFNEDLITTQDYDMWFRLASKYKFYGINKFLVKGRNHHEQTSNTLKEKHSIEINNLFTRFVKQLSIEEVLNGSGERSVCLGYAKLSLNFSQRYLLKSSKVASSLSIKTIRKSNKIDQVKTCFLLLKNYKILGIKVLKIFAYKLYKLTT